MSDPDIGMWDMQKTIDSLRAKLEKVTKERDELVGENQAYRENVKLLYDQLALERSKREEAEARANLNNDALEQACKMVNALNRQYINHTGMSINHFSREALDSAWETYFRKQAEKEKE